PCALPIFPVDCGPYRPTAGVRQGGGAQSFPFSSLLPPAPHQEKAEPKTRPRAMPMPMLSRATPRATPRASPTPNPTAKFGFLFMRHPGLRAGRTPPHLAVRPFLGLCPAAVGSTGFRLGEGGRPFPAGIK